MILRGFIDGPFGLGLISALLYAGYKIDQKHHKEIRRMLAAVLHSGPRRQYSSALTNSSRVIHCVLARHTGKLIDKDFRSPSLIVPAEPANSLVENH